MSSLLVSPGNPNPNNDPNFYLRLFSTIIQLDQTLQSQHYKLMQSQQPNSFIPQSINDTFTLIQKAYWKLYLQIYQDQISDFDKKQIKFYLSSKGGKALSNQIQNNNNNQSGGNKLPKWFMYKSHVKKQMHFDEEDQPEDDFFNTLDIPQRKARRRSKIQQSTGKIKYQPYAGYQSYIFHQNVDPYFSNLKQQAQTGKLPQIQIMYKFFSIKKLLQNSKDLMDIQKITTLYKNGNSFDRQDKQQIEDQKQKYRQKFRLYTELIACYEKFGYGSRKAKKQVKEKLTGTIYQYAVVHIAKIMFKLLQKYIMFFVNKKAKYTHRSKLQKTAYNFFNLSSFFPQQLKPVFIRLLKIIFQVGFPLPEITHPQLNALYQHILFQMDQKQRNPDNFKNEYMLKLENPTFYNVKKQIRQHVKWQSDQRKKLGIKSLGRHSKITKQIFQLSKSIVSQKSIQNGVKQQQVEEYYEKRRQKRQERRRKNQMEKLEKLEKLQPKQKQKKIKKQAYYDDYDEEQEDQYYQFDDQDNMSEIYSETDSQDVKNYFKKDKKKKNKDKKSKKNKKKEKKKDKYRY